MAISNPQPQDPNENASQHVDLSETEVKKLEAENDAVQAGAVRGMTLSDHIAIKNMGATEWQTRYPDEELGGPEKIAEVTAGKIAEDLGPLLNNQEIDDLRTNQELKELGPLLNDEEIDALKADQELKELGPLLTDLEIDQINANQEAKTKLAQGHIDTISTTESESPSQPKLTGKAAETYMALETPVPQSELEQKIDEGIYREESQSLGDIEGVTKDVDSAFESLTSLPAANVTKPMEPEVKSPNPMETIASQPLGDFTAEMEQNVAAQSRTDLPEVVSAEPSTGVKPEMAAAAENGSKDATKAAFNSLLNATPAEQQTTLSAELDSAIENLPEQQNTPVKGPDQAEA